MTHLISQGCDFSGSCPPAKVEPERNAVALEPRRAKQIVTNPSCTTAEYHYPVNKVCVSLQRVTTNGQVGLSRTISLQSAMCLGTGRTDKEKRSHYFERKDWHSVPLGSQVVLAFVFGALAFSMQAPNYYSREIKMRFRLSMYLDTTWSQLVPTGRQCWRRITFLPN